MSIFQCPISNPKTKWRLEAYFFILGGIQLIFLLVLIVCQKKFRIIELNPQQIEQNQFVPQGLSSSTDERGPMMYS